MANMVTLQAWRLEKKRDDTNEFKQYTAFTDGVDTCFFGYSRIGSKWQPSNKPGGDAAGRCQSQMQSKRREGYEQVWSGDLTVPAAWASDPKHYLPQLQDMAEAAFRKGSAHAEAGTPVASDIPQTPLAGLLDDCQRIVSKMAVSPDEALQDYAELLTQRELAADEMNVVDGYLDTLRLMIGVAST